MSCGDSLHAEHVLGMLKSDLHKEGFNLLQYLGLSCASTSTMVSRRSSSSLPLMGGYLTPRTPFAERELLNSW